MPLIRILTSADTTDAVLAVVEAEVSCTGLIVLPGASRRPPGDVVLCEVGRAGVDPVVGKLDGIDGTSVWLQESEPLLTPDESPIDREDAVMWAQVADLLGRQSRFSWLFAILISLAGAIAAIGIVDDQILLIIGAMAISPDYFPLIGGCLAIILGRPTEFWRSAATLAAGFGAAAVAGFVVTELLLRMNLVDDAAFTDVALFVAKPSWISVIVAVLAGVAGALSVTLADNRALVGVFVSVTTIPAAAGIGVGLATRESTGITGSAIQLAANLVSLYAAGTFTLWVQRTIWRRRTGYQHPWALREQPADAPGADR